MVDRSTPARKLGGLGKREGLEACCMVLALLIRSSLACLASRFSHCTQQGCWFGGFCHQKNSNSSQDLGTENHIPSSSFVVSAISVRAVSGCKRIFLRLWCWACHLSYSYPPCVSFQGWPSRWTLSGGTPTSPRSTASCTTKSWVPSTWSSRTSAMEFEDFRRNASGRPCGSWGWTPRRIRIFGRRQRAFVEVLMKSHLPGLPDSLVMFGLLNCLRFELPQGLQTLGRSWSPIHRPIYVSPFHPGRSDSGMVQFWFFFVKFHVSWCFIPVRTLCQLCLENIWECLMFLLFHHVSPILFQLCIAAARHRTNWQSISNRFRPNDDNQIDCLCSWAKL